MSSIIDYIESTTIKYVETIPKAERKKIGQFFSSKEIAIYMASMFSIPLDKNKIKILDPGAGTGILVAALIERIQKFEVIEQIDVTCYENDTNVVGLLKENLEWISANSSIKIKFSVIEENYILFQKSEMNFKESADKNISSFDLVIGNPPYIKISKNAPEAKALSEVCYGTPNMYFLFATMSILNLKTDGELVYIIPRSWTSGAYFKKFRQYLFSNCTIQNIHLFVSRDKVFKSEDVLQETIIIKIRKNKIIPTNIMISTSNSGVDLTNEETFEAPYDVIVEGEEKYVFLVSNEKDLDVLKIMNRWNDTLPKLGMRMKTGVTVDFRNRDILRNNAFQEEVVPLFYSQHLMNGEVIFPIGKDNEFITTERKGVLQKNKNYLFVKRFTSKEEARRLQCGIYLSRKYKDYNFISTQNKLNFIDGVDNLSECVIYGLYVVFNSTIYDRYYRILNGSTQVNSTEVNSMPMPSIQEIEDMGKKLQLESDMLEATCNEIIERYI